MRTYHKTSVQRPFRCSAKLLHCGPIWLQCKFCLNEDPFGCSAKLLNCGEAGSHLCVLKRPTLLNSASRPTSSDAGPRTSCRTGMRSSSDLTKHKEGLSGNRTHAQLGKRLYLHFCVNTSTRIVHQSHSKGPQQHL